MSNSLLLAAFLASGCHQRYEKSSCKAKIYFWLVSLARSRACLLHLLLDVLLILFIIGGAFLQFQFDSYLFIVDSCFIEKNFINSPRTFSSRQAAKHEPHFWVS